MATFSDTATTDSPAGEVTRGPRLISFVLPVYDEEATLQELHAQISNSP